MNLKVSSTRPDYKYEPLFGSDNFGIGTKMMAELEGRVKEMGAVMVQLVSVNDELHEHFYGKLGYGDASNLKLKSKFL